MRFFFESYKRFKEKTEVKRRCDSSLMFLRHVNQNDKDILQYAICLNDVSIIKGNTDGQLHEIASAKQADDHLAGCNSLIREMVPDLIRYHHAAEHYAANEIGWQECKAVKRIIDRYAIYCNERLHSWNEAYSEAKKFLSTFYRAVNYGYEENPLDDEAIPGYVDAIVAETAFRGQEMAVSRFRRNMGPLRVPDDTAKNISQSTILGVSMLKDMDFITRQLLVDYLSAIIDGKAHKQAKHWPIKVIDLRPLKAYDADFYRLRDVLRATLDKFIVYPDQKHMEYKITNGVLTVSALC